MVNKNRYGILNCGLTCGLSCNYFLNFLNNSFVDIKNRKIKVQL